MRTSSSLLIGLGAALVAACSEPATESSGKQEAVAPEAQQTISIYSTRHYDSDRLMYQAFEDATGIRVRAREGGSGALLEAMKAEGDASPADLVLATDAGTLWRFQDEGLLQAVDSEALNALIPEALREPDGYWYGVSRRARVVVYDPTRYTAEQIGSYAALASEEVKDDVCMRSSSNIYNLSLMGELIERWGEAEAENWASRVTANFARQPTGGDTTQIESIAAGECSVALINHYYWARLVSSDSDDRRAIGEATKLIFPDGGDGTHVNITGAAVAKNAPNKEGAIAFIEFLASKKGQAMLISETKEFPIRDDIDLPAGLEALPEFTASTVPLTRFGENQAKAQAIYDRAGWK